MSGLSSNHHNYAYQYTAHANVLYDDGRDYQFGNTNYDNALGYLPFGIGWKLTTLIHNKFIVCLLITMILLACITIYTISIAAELRKETRNQIIIFQDAHDDDPSNRKQSHETHTLENVQITRDSNRENMKFEQLDKQILSGIPSTNSVAPPVKPYILTFKGQDADAAIAQYEEINNIPDCVSPQFSRFTYRFYLSYAVDTWGFYPPNINGQGIQGLSLDSLVNFSLCCKLSHGEFQCSESQYLSQYPPLLTAMIITNHENNQHFLKIKFTQLRLTGSQCILNFVSEECK